MVVARKTGLTAHVIRAWEKRYGVVSPLRTPTNRRLYSDADVERLRLLRRATLAGHGIGQIATLPTEALNTLLVGETAETAPPPPPRPSGEVAPTAILERCLAAIAAFDAETLEATLTQAAVTLSQPLLTEQVIVPMLYTIGDLWRLGELRAAHEHLASAVVRSSLGNLGRGFVPSPTAPTLIITTPAGQLHEFGALIVAAAAASDGWRATYLGPSLPAAEIAAAAHQSRARAVALSIVYPADDPHLRDELLTLRRGLAGDMALLVGGRAAEAYAGVLDKVGAIRAQGMEDLRRQLESLRRHRPSARPPQ
jgi:DNA-binding transcriptional MerR regulator/methylmalonyl-CoA mutase cobalamin-binding subunit